MSGASVVTSARTQRALARFEAAAKLHETGDVVAAVGQYRAALRDVPRFAAGHMLLGLALAALKQYGDAETSLRRALAIDPTLADAHLAIAKLQIVAGDDVAAANSLRDALHHDPKNIPAICEWWVLAERMERLAECVTAGRRYMALRPEHHEARWDLALQELAIGDLAAGWVGYEKRWDHPYYATWRYPVSAPEWHGESLAGQRILVWREQGVGDEIMFASCVPDLVAAAGQVTLACTDRLVSLFTRSFPQACVIDANRIAPPTPESVETDYHCAIGALPHRFRPTVASFPTRPAYLVPDPTRVDSWRDRLAALGPGLRVGISWRSGMMTEKRARGYASLDQWGPLLRTAGAVFINLQYDDCQLALATAEDQFGTHIHTWPDLDLRNDFEASAALMVNLDLVITIGNAVGELAGALGVPVWRLSPSPVAEWTMLGTDRRPWFPTMRVCQAPRTHEWTELIARVASDLQRRVAQQHIAPRHVVCPTTMAAA